MKTVYVLLNTGVYLNDPPPGRENVMYVGVTMDPIRRMGEHSKLKPWHEVQRIDLIHYDDDRMACEVEADLIADLTPPWNKQLFGGRRPPCTSCGRG